MALLEKVRSFNKQQLQNYKTTITGIGNLIKYYFCQPLHIQLLLGWSVIFFILAFFPTLAIAVFYVSLKHMIKAMEEFSG